MDRFLQLSFTRASSKENLFQLWRQLIAFITSWLQKSHSENSLIIGTSCMSLIWWLGVPIAESRQLRNRLDGLAVCMDISLLLNIFLVNAKFGRICFPDGFLLNQSPQTSLSVDYLLYEHWIKPNSSGPLLKKSRRRSRQSIVSVKARIFWDPLDGLYKTTDGKIWAPDREYVSSLSLE